MQNIFQNNPKVLKWTQLDSKNASATVKDKCLGRAIMEGSECIVELMIRRGTTIPTKAMEFACKYGKKEIIDCLIRNGCQFWDHGLYGACSGGHMWIVKWLVTKVIDVNMLEHHDVVLTEAIGRASSRNHINIIQYLLEKYPQVNQDKIYTAAFNGACVGWFQCYSRRFYKKRNI